MKFRLSWAALAVSVATVSSPATAAPAIDKDYVRSLAAPGKTVLVVEYYDGSGKVAERRGFASASGYKALSGTDIRVDEKTTIHLYGIAPCNGEMVNRAEDFSGSCQQFAKDQLEAVLKNPKVVFCRAFITELNAPLQNATCYAYHFFPDALDSVSMIEEQLLSIGGVQLVRKADGTPERPDLTKAEEIGRKGSYGMWADPRIKGDQ